MGQSAKKASKEKMGEGNSPNAHETRVRLSSRNSILKQQAGVTNQILKPDGVPPIVQDVLRSTGRPLDFITRAFMESRFNQDFSQVRIHDNRQASDSASTLNALAYTAGHHIVFRTGHYKPNSSTGKRLLSHELAHVAQHTHHTSRNPQRIADRGSASERNAESATASISSGGSAQVAPVGTAQVALFRDTRLDKYLLSLPQIAKRAPQGTSPHELVRRIILHFRGVNLRDPDNLRPVSTLVAQHFPIDVFSLFLQRVEADVSAARMSHNEARYQNTILKLRQLSRNRLGGPGGPFPLAGMVAHGTSRGARMLSANVIEFARGIAQGMREAKGSDKLPEKFLQKYMQSYTIGVVGPSVFATGALVGIGKDFWKTLKGIWELITNFSGMMKEFKKLFKTLIETTGVTRILGRKIGLEWHAKLWKLADNSVFKITYELGKLIGPTIVYAVLWIIGMFTGIGAVISIPGAIARLAKFLITIIRRIPVLSRIATRIGGFFARRISRTASRLGRKASHVKRVTKKRMHRPDWSSRKHYAERSVKRRRKPISRKPPAPRPTESLGREGVGRAAETAPKLSRKLVHRKRRKSLPWVQQKPRRRHPAGRGVSLERRQQQPGVRIQPYAQARPERYYYDPRPGKPGGGYYVRKSRFRKSRSPRKRTVNRPLLPRGNAPTLSTARFRNFQEPFRGQAAVRQQQILNLAKNDPKLAGRQFQQLVAEDLKAVDVQEMFPRPGRRPDIGVGHEVTLEGASGPFSTTKLDQFWLDLRDRGQVLLTVPKLSKAAESQLLRLGAQAEQLFQKMVIIIIRRTL